jgi:methionine-S-sulfoxide reductase
MFYLLKDSSQKSQPIAGPTLRAFSNLMLLGLFILIASACTRPSKQTQDSAASDKSSSDESLSVSEQVQKLRSDETLNLATFAGGCFWCMEPPYEKHEGVQEVISGFSGGESKNPSYKAVAGGRTKHIEAVQVFYDPKVLSYEDLLEIFWRQINPTDSGGQFVDRGYQYSTAIFYHDQDQKKTAEASKEKLEKGDRFKKKIVTKIRPFEAFYPAETHHQDYYKKSSLKYKFYRSQSGRDDYLEEKWGEDLEYRPKGPKS